MAQALKDIPFTSMDGKKTSIGDYTGKVLLIVNVASECGLTPQYTGLEKIYEQYREKGLVVLGFPANEFGAQEPGTNEQIQLFCRGTFGVQFPMFQKIVVKGDGQHPLYAALTTSGAEAILPSDSKLKEKLAAVGLLSGGPKDITWNFEKFLIGRDGKVLGRFAPDMTPEDPILVQAIEKALG